MGIPDELLVDQRQISPALRCVICTEVFVEPVASGSSTSCQHVFCLSCISRALANKAECPLCREEMHVLRLRRCQPLQALVDEVQVRCKYSASGCGWRGRLDESATHQAVCPVVENVTLNRRLAMAQKRIFDLETDQKKGLKIISSLKAKLESKEKSLLWIQKEKAHLVWQAGELFSQKNKMSTKIKDWQVSFDGTGRQVETGNFRAKQETTAVPELQRRLSTSPYQRQAHGSVGDIQVFVKEFTGRHLCDTCQSAKACEALFREAWRSLAKPLRSPREASVDQFPTTTLSPAHVKLKPHFPFFHLLRRGILLWLDKSLAKPLREGRGVPRSRVAQIHALRSHLRSPPISVQAFSNQKKSTAQLEDRQDVSQTCTCAVNFLKSIETVSKQLRHGARTRVIQIDPQEDVEEIESQIAAKTKIAQDKFYLICMGRVLQPGACPADYGISRDSTLIMTGRLLCSRT